MMPFLNQIKRFTVGVICLYSAMAWAEPSASIENNAKVVATIGALEFRRCTLPFQSRERTVQCASHTVPENPAEPGGKQIDLFVVRLPAKSRAKDVEDPILFIAGGPGQAASEVFLFADQMWRSLAKKRDFYLIDQRGTGRSGFLGCGDSLKTHATAAEPYNSSQIKQHTRECLEQLSGDPRFYTTDLTVKDFEQVRQALEITQWNVLGVSYGTRVISHYMRRFPQSIRTAVMDSVIPPEHVIGEQVAIRSQQALDVLLSRCTEDDACDSHFPALEKNVSELFHQLDIKPVTVMVENLSTGGVEARTFTREELAMLVRLNLYHPSSASVLPPILHQAVTQRYFSPLIRSASLVAQDLESAMSYGLHHSIMCSEEYPFYALTEEEVRANEESFLGMSVINFITDVCSVWPTGEVPGDMKTPLVSEVPALLLSGEYDPITPPEYADRAMQSLHKARHLVLKGQGHFVSHTGCAPRIIEEFVDSQSVTNLDTACLERLSAAPIYLNYNGTAP